MAAKSILYAVTKGNFGGAQKYVYDLATNLPQNFRPLVICGRGGDLKKNLERAGIPARELPNLDRDVAFLSDLQSFLALGKIIAKIRPAILHLNSPKIGGLGALAGRVLGIKKIIYTSHGWPFNENRPCWQKTALKFLSWLTVILSHRTIVIAKSELKDVVGWPLARGKIHLVYNGIKPPAFLTRPQARAELSGKIGQALSETNLWVGTIAELHKNKGLEYGVRALAALQTSHPRLIWVVIGEGEERLRLEELIRNLRLENRVFLVGAVMDAARLLPAFDVFMLSSVKEGLPYTLLEAGAAGLPTVAAAVGGAPEIIADGESGLLVPPAAPAKLAAALAALADNAPKRSRLGETLRQKIRNNFSFEKTRQHTLALYAGGENN